jgi:hypothetical protein
MFAVWFGEINMTKSYVEMNMCRSNGEVRKTNGCAFVQQFCKTLRYSIQHN